MVVMLALVLLDSNRNILNKYFYTADYLSYQIGMIPFRNNNYNSGVLLHKDNEEEETPHEIDIENNHHDMSWRTNFFMILTSRLMISRINIDNNNIDVVVEFLRIRIDNLMEVYP